MLRWTNRDASGSSDTKDSLMRIVSIAIIVAGVFAGGVSSLRVAHAAQQRSRPSAGRSPGTGSTKALAAVGVYCAGCHNGAMRSPSGVLLDRFDTAAIARNPDVWARAYRQVQAGTMPPVGAPRPDRRESALLLASIERALGVDAAPPKDVTGHEIAGRLARLLWDSAPDAALLDDANRNRLTARAPLERQVRRMLADGRARAFVSRFFFPWLGLDQLAKAEPDATQFPEFDADVRDAMTMETELFVLNQLREDRDPIALWNANDTFLNEQLARHYGIPGVTGRQFRRVTLPGQERAGLLGQGSVLMVTSRHQHGNDAGYTSPARRALWIRWHFLGAPPPQPFPGAQPVNPELPITPQTRVLPAAPCVACHRNFFPLGYALENFDPIGRWRTRDQAGPVDTSGSFVDGTPTNGVVELRNVLLQRPDAFRTTITEKLLVYASGDAVSASRPASPGTLARARQILRGTTPVRWSSIIAAVVSAGPLEE
jgi:hypothetical protein